MKHILHNLKTLREQLVAQQDTRRIQRMETMEAEQTLDGKALRSLTLADDVRAFCDMVLAHIHHDMYRLHPPHLPTPTPDSPPATPAGNPPTAPGLPNPTSTPLPALPSLSSVLNGTHIVSPLLRPLLDTWAQHQNLVPSVDSHLTGPAAALYDFLHHELVVMIDEQTQRGGANSGSVNKLKQAVQAFFEERVTDCITILKIGANNDPHNHTLLTCLSQILYYQAANGHPTALPEAREYGQRSMIHSESAKPTRLNFYCYLAIINERAFSAERALELLRDSGLLSTYTIQTNKDFLLADRGIYLRAWAILSTIPADLWSDYERHHLVELATLIPGGGMLYLAWFRTMMVGLAGASKVPISEFETLEKHFKLALLHYTDIRASAQKLPARQSPLPWALRLRWMNTLLAIAPTPTFDQILAMTALDANLWRDGVFPDNELRALLDFPQISYWNCWISAITPYKDRRQPFLLPATDAVHDDNLLPMLDKLLDTLKIEEQARIQAAVWDDIRPWMARWQLEHLLATATGSNQPRSRFAPSLTPFSHFYRRWRDPIISAILPSEIIAETARRGAFANLFEAATAFEGAARLLDDPAYGLMPNQRRAYTEAMKKIPEKLKDKPTDFANPNGLAALALLPVGLLGGVVAIVIFSSNWSQALGLIVALCGACGVVALNLKRA